jgi:dTDP-4-dehydrorhamnose 3,5-epimerase
MALIFEKTSIDGVVVIEPEVFTDERGFFLELYKESDFGKFGINEYFVQDNHSLSNRGVLRGLHYQLPPRTQAKLVYVLSGTVWDVAVDIRRNSSTFKQWVAVELSGENRKRIYIPEGFAHGFLALTDSAHVIYKCTKEYSPEHDCGIRWDDEEIGIAWPVKKPILSDKDKNLPYLRDAEIFE